MNNIIKPIALYLPQYHAIPENDRWWGKGFTEWTNVVNAKPLFPGHVQPKLPTDLGFYDLRVPEIRQAQADIARASGLYGFCYWHYWFSGKQILERPFNEVVKSGEPDFPFCLAWANQTWQGTWHGLSEGQTLIEQKYPGKEDFISHFYAMLDAFRDKRYLEINGRKLFFVFRPMDIPEPQEFIDTWQSLAEHEGIGGFHFVGMFMPPDWQPENFGFNAMVSNFLNRPDYYTKPLKLQNVKRNEKFFNAKIHQAKLAIYKKKEVPSLELLSYKKYVDNLFRRTLKPNEYPWIMPGWDNTPRTGVNGWLFEGSTPELFGELCLKAFRETENKSTNERIVLLKSWNEWAEGNYLEPDRTFGHTFLQALRDSTKKYYIS